MVYSLLFGAVIQPSWFAVLVCRVAEKQGMKCYEVPTGW